MLSANFTKAVSTSSHKRTSTRAEKETKKPKITSERDTIETLPFDVNQICSDNWTAIHSHMVRGPRFSSVTVYHLPIQDYSLKIIHHF